MKFRYSLLGLILLVVVTNSGCLGFSMGMGMAEYDYDPIEINQWKTDPEVTSVKCSIIFYHDHKFIYYTPEGSITGSWKNVDYTYELKILGQKPQQAYLENNNVLRVSTDGLVMNTKYVPMNLFEAFHLT